MLASRRWPVGHTSTCGADATPSVGVGLFAPSSQVKPLLPMVRRTVFDSANQMPASA